MNEKMRDMFYNMLFYLLIAAVFLGIVAIFYIPMHNDYVNNIRYAETAPEENNDVQEENDTEITPRIPESMIYHNLDIEIGLPY